MILIQQEVATIAGSTINHEVALVGTGMTDITKAFRQIPIEEEIRKKTNRRRRGQSKQQYKQQKHKRDITSDINDWHTKPTIKHTKYKSRYPNKYETAAVGAGIGGGFQHTSELHVMKFDKVMKKPDKKKWQKAVHEEYKRFKK